MKNLFTDNECKKRKNDPTIFSIVVPTFNEEKYIGALLDRLIDFVSDDFKIEIIIIDNGSSDDTLTIVQKYPCVLHVLPDATIAEMRNYGASEAHGKWIGFIDADCMPIKKWAVLAKTKLEDSPKIGVIGSFYSMSPDTTWVERLWYSMRSATIGKVNFLPAGNMAVRRSEFLKFKGFPCDMITGEDYGLCQKYIHSSYYVVNDPFFENIHFGNVKTMLDVYKKEIWYGMSYKRSFKENMLSKVFWATVVFLMGCLLIILSPVYRELFDNVNNFLIVGSLFSGGIVISYALAATIRAGKCLYFLGYILIFFAYFSGRSTAIMKLILS